MNVIPEVEGGQPRKKKPVEVLEDVSAFEEPTAKLLANQAPVMQFEATMVDDGMAGGAKKKKKKKKKTTRADEDDENL